MPPCSIVENGRERKDGPMSARSAACLIFILIVILFASGWSQISLQKTPFWQSSEINMTTTGMIWRDCNKDGHIDVFFSNGNDITLSPNTIYLSNNGILPASADWFSANNEYSGHCAVGDINDDGWPDFAVSNFLGENGFSSANHSNLYLNSEGIINASPDWYTGDSIYTFSCAFGDADGDGDLDLAFSTGESYGDRKYTDRIYYNIDGTLESLPAWESDAATEAMDVTWGDVNNDGYLDLAFCYDDRPPAIHYNDAGDIETTPSWEALDNESGNTLIFGDVDGDGWQDLIVAFNYQLGGSGRFRVYFNDGSGTLSNAYGWQSASGGYGSALALNDYDQDGDLDLAAGRWWDEPRVYRNSGSTLSTSPVWQSDVSTVVEELAWVDVDGSGLTDLADTIYDIAGKKAFYTAKMPLYAIDSVMADGIWLGHADYCYDLVSGWVALGQIPSDSLIIRYKYSTENDLAVANWDTYNMVYGYISVALTMTASDFSDILGDDDGILEAGETIQMTVSLINSGGEADHDVSLNLIIEDASLTVTDGSSYIGDIAPFTTVSNNSDPFEFDIPADYISRIDSFFIEVIWDSGTEIDTFAIEKAIGKPALLLVDDDNNDDLETIYIGAMANFRIPVDHWDIFTSGVPDAVTLSEYELVIWYTGDYRTSPLSGSAATFLKSYLDGGGSLFLTGQAIADQLDFEDVDFLNNYIKSSYQSSSLLPVLEGVAGAYVVDSGIRIALTGFGSAGNQTLPDLIQPVNGGVAELIYLSQTDYGAVSYTGDYKSLFFSFGIEALGSGDSRWRDRDSIFADIINFFDFQKPGGYPEVASAAVSPGDPFHLTDHTPDFSWNYYNPESSPQLMYHIQVGSDANWDYAEMWDYGPISGSETTITYDGLELLDGQPYNFRIRVFDGSLWSEWYQNGFRMNSLPDVVIGLTPDNMACLGETNPELTHLNAEDPENDNLTYAYRVYDDPGMTNLVALADGHPEQIGTITSWQIDVSLADNTTYYWVVRAADGFEDNPWSESASFQINNINQSPGPFALLLPDSGAFLADPLPTFGWEGSIDPDPCDSVYYLLLYATNPSMIDPIIVSGLEATSYTATDSLAGGKYYWRIIANDLFDGETTCVSDFSFSIGAMGDANSDGLVNVGDAVFLISYVFKGGPAPDPYENGDANCDATVNVGDAVYLVNYIFRSGPPPGCFEK